MIKPAAIGTNEKKFFIVDQPRHQLQDNKILYYYMEPLQGIIFFFM